MKRTGSLVLGCCALILLLLPSGCSEKAPSSDRTGITKGKLVLGPVAHPRLPSNPLVITDAGMLSAPVRPSAPMMQAIMLGPRTVDLRALVLAGDGSEPSFDALKRFLSNLGVPFDAVITRERGLTPEMFTTSPAQGKYAAVFLATDSLGYFDQGAGSWGSALTPAEWGYLRGYEEAFGVREVRYYAYPTADVGLAFLEGRDTDDDPINAVLTPIGQDVFAGLNPVVPIVVRGAWCYPAELVDPTTTVPLAMTDEGRVLIAIHTYPDGREVLVSTMDNNYFLVHSLAYAYGIINWAFRGLHLGERRVYLAEEIDDLFIDNDIYPLPGEEPRTYRITGADLQGVYEWQSRLEADILPAGSNFKLDMAFNGAGTVRGEYPDDTLTPKAKDLKASFFWTSHTWDHENLDALTRMQCNQEARRNIDRARNFLALPGFEIDSMVTPDISGLENTQCLRGLFDQGVRYVVGNTSIPWMTPAGQNVGMYAPAFPSMTIVPRHPTNLFYNVTSPEEWVAEYNELYQSWFGREMSYEEILGVESDIALLYMLSYDIAPLMFHQANLAVYRSPTYGIGILLADWTEALLEKYEEIYTLPVRCLSLHQIALKAQERMAYEACGVTASIQHVPGSPRRLVLRSTGTCTVPVTGIAKPLSGLVEYYAGQPTTYVQLRPNVPVVVSLD